MRIVITGASGKAGQATLRHFTDNTDHDIVATDLAPRPSWYDGRFFKADLTQVGEAMDLLVDADAVIHLANIPADNIHTDTHTLNQNLLMNTNVFMAAWKLRLKRIVWASSETTLGLPFDEVRYVPVDEDHYPLPNSTYSLSKVMTETMGAEVARWAGIPVIALRLSNIFTVDDYAMQPSFAKDPEARRWNLFGYVDARDVAQSCEDALTADLTGAHSFVIAADDIILDMPTRDALKAIHPDLTVPDEVAEFGTLLSNRAAAEKLGWRPRHSWRDVVA
ncbi:NAD-dependent epimerase/dehydratase family protein [Tessaracoccus sp. Y36]